MQDTAGRVERGPMQYCCVHRACFRDRSDQVPYRRRTVLGYCKAHGIEPEVFIDDNRAACFHAGCDT